MTRRFGGTGLCLTLCKQMVGLLGGKLWFNSEVGKGSTFSFSIPVKVLPFAVSEEKREPSSVEERVGAVRAALGRQGTGAEFEEP